MAILQLPVALCLTANSEVGLLLLSVVIILNKSEIVRSTSCNFQSISARQNQVADLLQLPVLRLIPSAWTNRAVELVQLSTTLLNRITRSIHCNFQ